MREWIKRKILLVLGDFYFVSKGYTLYKYSLEGNLIEEFGSIKDRYQSFSKNCLTKRLFRAEITFFYRLQNGAYLAVAKKGLFKKEGSGEIRKVWSLVRGSKPLNLCILPNGHIYFGEYFQNREKDAVHVYGSYDNGETWQIVYTFESGTINHIHGLFYDTYTDRIWFLTGDREEECLIGYTEDEFSTTTIVFKGGQEYRACQLFFYPSFICYATDSQYMQNEIKCFDRKTLEIKTLVKIQGSAVKGGQSRNISFLSTTVEPSGVNLDKDAHIWITKDGMHWEDVYSATKDCWPPIFQFGTFEFPQYLEPITDRLYFSGRALKGYDGRSTFIEI